MKIFPTDYTEKTDIDVNDMILFSDSEDWDKLKKAKYSNLKWDKWDTWATGATWPTWPQWATGATWATGAQGIQWIKWDKWETWATGATGATWPQWAQWPQWVKWDKWDTGAQWPQGIQGIQWPAWANWTNGTDWEDWISFTPKWAYSSGTAYVPNDVVSYLGSSWIALQNTTGNTPSEWAYWTLNAAKGTDWEWAWDISGSGVANEIAYFTAEKTIDNLPVATYPSLPELSYVKWVTSAIQTQIWNQVPKSLYDANTIIKADTDNTPAALTVWEQTLVGRKTWWVITALTPTEVRTMINVADWATANTKATWAEIDTWTDDAKYVTAKAIADQTVLLKKSGWTMTGKVTNAGRDEVAKTYTPASGSQTVTIDCSVNNIHEVTGNASGTAITFAVSNVTNSQVFMVSITQGSTVSTIAWWFATIRWAGWTAPTLTATANKRDCFGFRRTWTNTYDWFVIGQNC